MFCLEAHKIALQELMIQELCRKLLIFQYHDYRLNSVLVVMWSQYCLFLDHWYKKAKMLNLCEQKYRFNLLFIDFTETLKQVSYIVY